MAQTFDVYPSGDIANDGWTLVASSVNTVWEILSSGNDDCHVRCPSYRGGVEVSFPVDVSSLPAGAVIDSVTVFIRMATNAGSGPRSVTVNVLSYENRSRYTTRTLPATSAITTYEVATYTKDPLGKAWDISRLNRLRMRFFSYNNLFDSIRIYALYARINYHTKPTVTVTAPSGTVNTPSPTISWSYLQQEGEPQKTAEYRIFTLSDATATTFNPDTAPAIYSSGEISGSASDYVLPTSLNNNDYMVYVRTKSQFGCKSDWASRQFTVNAPSPGVPGDNNAGVSGLPGIGTPTVVPDNYTSSAAIRMTDTSNLLAVQAADFEIASDPVPYVGQNCTLTRDTSFAFGVGVASMKMVATTSASMQAVGNKQEISASMPMTIRAQFLAGATSRTINLYAKFYDPDYSYISGSDIVATGTSSTSTWTEITANGDSPSTAKYCEIWAEVVSATAGAAHYVDHVGLMYGYNTAWSDGGHASRNMLTSFLATGDDPASNVDSWQQANSATTIQRVAATGTGAHGAKCHQMSYVGVSPSISYRATSTVFTSATSGVNYTLNKPVGTADNDLLLAFVTSTEFGTITPPPGWTAVNTAAIDDGSTDVALWVLKRTGLASDPTSWTTGVVSATSSRRTAVVVAYSGAASADQQFIAEGTSAQASEPITLQTATVVNTDPNAWRVAAFAASDDHTLSGGITANVTPPSTVPAIQYVGKATAWAQTSDTLSFTLNKPAGVKSGDLLIAGAVFSGNTTTVTAPSGWTLVRREYRASSGDNDWHSGDVTVAIFKRTAGASEPNSWTGTHSDYGRPKITQVVAYRNCDDASNQFLANNVNKADHAASVNTGAVTNTNSNAWRICMFAATTNYGDSWSGGDTWERSDDSTNLSGYPDTVIQFSDSNGPISTGVTSRSATIDSGSFFAAIGWIGIIKPLASPPTPGANETSRTSNNNGSSSPWLGTAVFDSNATIATGATSVYGTAATSDGLGTNSMASWIGIIRPASSVTGGVAEAYTSSKVDISSVDSGVLTLAGNKVTVMASFLGSSAGTPSLSLDFYRANQLISSQSALGSAFNTSVWTKSWAYFDLPDGTDRIRTRLSALGRSVGDTVQFDKVAVMLGGSDDQTVEPQWHNGTARPEHPIWSKPVIEYQENDGTGYGEWQLLAGQTSQPPMYDLNTLQMQYVDHTIVPLNSRRYRVSTLSYGLNGDLFSSGFGPASQEAIFEPRTWWLKDIKDLSKNMQITVRWKDMPVTRTNTATTFQPLGEDFPVVVSEGFKSDTFSMDIHCEQSEFTQLMQLLNSGRTLILQSDIDQMWWVRPVGDVQANILATASRQDRPRRYVTVTWVQVAAED